MDQLDPGLTRTMSRPCPGHVPAPTDAGAIAGTVRGRGRGQRLCPCRGVGPSGTAARTDSDWRTLVSDSREHNVLRGLARWCGACVEGSWACRWPAPHPGAQQILTTVRDSARGSASDESRAQFVTAAALWLLDAEAAEPGESLPDCIETALLNSDPVKQG